MNDKTLYETAANELENNRDEALWIKALVENDGDETKARFFYIKERVRELDNVKAGLSNTTGFPSSKNYRPIYENSSIYFHGPLADEIREQFCLVANVDQYGKVRCDLLVSDSDLAVVPSGKSRPFLELAASGSPVFGMLGLLGGVALGAAAVASKINQNNERASVRERAESFDQFAILSINGCKLKVKEVEAGSMWEIGGRTWATWFLITGQGVYKNQVNEMSIRFGVPGRSTTSTLLDKKIDDVDKICKLLKQPQPQIIKGRSVFEPNGEF